MDSHYCDAVLCHSSLIALITSYLSIHNLITLKRVNKLFYDTIENDRMIWYNKRIDCWSSDRLNTTHKSLHRSIQSLYLEENRNTNGITHHTIELLNTLHSLTSLSILLKSYDSAIELLSSDAVKHLHSLTLLDKSNARCITPSCLFQLKDSTNLTAIDLLQAHSLGLNEISMYQLLPSSVQQLAVNILRMAPSNSESRLLDMLEMDTFSVRQIHSFSKQLQYLHTLPSLHTLDLVFQSVHLQHIYSDLSGVKSLRSLSLKIDHHKVTDTNTLSYTSDNGTVINDLSLLSRLPYLTSLTLVNISGGNEAKSLSSLSHTLQHLELKGCITEETSDSWQSSITTLHHLQTLVVSDNLMTNSNCVTDNFISCVSTLKKLRVLKMLFCSMLSSRIWQHFIHLQHLQYIKLHEDAVDVVCVEKLAKQCVLHTVHMNHVMKHGDVEKLRARLPMIHIQIDGYSD